MDEDAEMGTILSAPLHRTERSRSSECRNEEDEKGLCLMSVTGQLYAAKDEGALLQAEVCALDRKSWRMNF